MVQGVTVHGNENKFCSSNSITVAAVSHNMSFTE